MQLPCVKEPALSCHIHGQINEATPWSHHGMATGPSNAFWYITHYAPGKRTSKMQWKTVINYVYFWQQLGALQFRTFSLHLKKPKNQTIKEYWKCSLVPDHRSGTAVDTGLTCAESCSVTLGLGLHIPASQLINKTAMTNYPQFSATILSHQDKVWTSLNILLDSMKLNGLSLSIWASRLLECTKQ